MKKILTLVVVVALVATISVAGTLAWLTDTSAKVTNTFTVGDVEVTLDEAKTNEYGEAVAGASRVEKNKYKLIPGHEYTKDPIVRVTEGSEPCYVFIKVTNGIAGIEEATSMEQEGYKCIADQMEANGWRQYETDGNIYYYATTEGEPIVVDASAGQEDLPVFSNFTIAGDANTRAAWETISAVTVQACVVQADNLNLPDAYTEAAELLNDTTGTP